MPAYGHRDIPFLILSGASLSDALQLNGVHGEAILMPAAWTAAGLGFVASDTVGGVFLPVVDALGVEITFTVAASQMIMMPVGLLRAMNFIRLRSGTTAVPVNQGANRTLILTTRAYA